LFGKGKMEFCSVDYCFVGVVTISRNRNDMVKISFF